MDQQNLTQLDWLQSFSLKFASVEIEPSEFRARTSSLPASAAHATRSTARSTSPLNTAAATAANATAATAATNGTSAPSSSSSSASSLVTTIRLPASSPSSTSTAARNPAAAAPRTLQRSMSAGASELARRKAAASSDKERESLAIFHLTAPLDQIFATEALDTTRRPGVHPVVLASLPLLEAADQALSLAQIVTWVKNRFLYFAQPENISSCRAALRAALSSHPCFVRSKTETAKSFLFSLDAEYVPRIRAALFPDELAGSFPSADDNNNATFRKRSKLTLSIPSGSSAAAPASSRPKKLATKKKSSNNLRVPRSRSPNALSPSSRTSSSSGFTWDPTIPASFASSSPFSSPSPSASSSSSSADSASINNLVELVFDNPQDIEPILGSLLPSASASYSSALAAAQARSAVSPWGSESIGLEQQVMDEYLSASSPEMEMDLPFIPGTFPTDDDFLNDVFFPTAAAGSWDQWASL